MYHILKNIILLVLAAPTSLRLKMNVVLILLTVSVIAEGLSISAVFPFLLVYTNPEKLFEYPIYHLFVDKDWNLAQLRLTVFVAFVVLVITATVLKSYAIISYVKFAQKIGNFISSSIVNRFLDSNYMDQQKVCSSFLIGIVTSKTNEVVEKSLIPLMVFTSSILSLSIVLSIIIILYGFYVLIVATAIGFSYYLVVNVLKKKLKEKSILIASSVTKLTQKITQMKGNNVQIKLDNMEKEISDNFSKIDLSYRESRAFVQIASALPKYILEMLGILVLCSVFVILSSDGDFTALIPNIGLLLFAMQRSLPLIQATYASFTNMSGAAQSTQEIQELLTIDVGKTTTVSHLNYNGLDKFKKMEISIDEVFLNSQKVLEDISFTIRRGDRILISGPSGSGKSTLLSLIIGFNEVNQGSIIINGKIPIQSLDKSQYFKFFSYVEQSPYFENYFLDELITNGSKKSLDMAKLKLVKNVTGIDRNIPNEIIKNKRKIGENGFELSGGQRQRIAVARSLYKSKDILVLDEATNALDQISEKQLYKKVFDAFPKLTIIVVSHGDTEFVKWSEVIKLK